MSANPPTEDHRSERNAGLLLIASALVAMALANSPWAGAWHHLLEAPLGMRLPQVGELTLHVLVSDGLMAIFFLLVGLEVKREWFLGRLSSAAARRMPIIAAAAGMAVPALVFLLVTRGEPALINGWAIPAATDIAFVIGVLAILGRHAPPAIKLLLVTIAIIDDIGAVIIIALAYTAHLDRTALAGMLAVTGAMAAMGHFGVRRLGWFMAGFVLLWVLTLASGIHATIAGVVAALTVPIAVGEKRSPLKKLEHAIHPWVMFGVVPLFGLVSAGVSLGGGLGALADPLPLGITLGLLIGKPLGVFTAIALVVRLKIAPLPPCTNWPQLLGASVLCGIGFTMSLFIAGLAFPVRPDLVDAAKIGILAGSLLSAVVGFMLLRTAPAVTTTPEDEEDFIDVFAGDEPDDESRRA